MAKTLELYSVTVLEAEGIKSTVSRRAAPWRVRGASPSIWFPHFCLCFITPVSATVIMLPLSFLSYLSLPHSFFKILLKFSSAAQLCPTLCDPHGLQHTRLPCPSPSPRACSNSCLLSQWCHPTISFCVVPFCLQSCPASESFPMSQFFTSGGQNIGVSASASVLPVNIQDWFPLGWTGWISLQSLVTYSYIHKYKTIGKTCYKNHSGEKEWEYNT